MAVISGRNVPVVTLDARARWPAFVALRLGEEGTEFCSGYLDIGKGEVVALE